MPRKPKILCTTAECDNEKGHSFGLCNACYMRMYYWDKRSLKDKMAHMKKLRVRENAMSTMLGNVKPIERAKRKAAGRK